MRHFFGAKPWFCNKKITKLGVKRDNFVPQSNFLTGSEWWYVLNPNDEKHIRNFYRAVVKERSLQPEPLVHNWWNDFVIEFGQWAKKCRNQHLSKTDAE